MRLVPGQLSLKFQCLDSNDSNCREVTALVSSFIYPKAPQHKQTNILLLLYSVSTRSWAHAAWWKNVENMSVLIEHTKWHMVCCQATRVIHASHRCKQGGAMHRRPGALPRSRHGGKDLLRSFLVSSVMFDPFDPEVLAMLGSNPELVSWIEIGTILQSGPRKNQFLPWEKPVLTMRPPKPTFLEVFMVYNLVFGWPRHVSFMGFGGSWYE